MAQRGFTLIELVVVIMLMGVIGLGVSQFIGMGAQIFVNNSERQDLVNESRFIVERINRELRNALPNSIRVTGNATRQCMEFVPITWSGIYVEIPVRPASASTQMRIVEPVGLLDTYSSADIASQFAVVYPTHSAQIYADPTTDPISGDLQGHRLPLSSLGSATANISPVTLASSARFVRRSPALRYYLVSQPVSYCVENRQVWRFANYGFTASQPTNPGSLVSGQLLAQNVVNNLADSSDLPFQVTLASLTRNAYLYSLLRFAKGGEQVAFSNKVQVQNVP